MKQTKIIRSLLALYLGMQVSTLALADDLEVYLQETNLPPEQVRPNVIFVLDSSGSMGLPLDSVNNGTSSYREDDNFNSSTTYPADLNYSGGPGEDDYFYFYERPNTFADQYIYYNKVHKDQLQSDCDFDRTDDFIAREYIYYEQGGDKEAMCYGLGSGSCNYITGSTGSAGSMGDKVGCDDDSSSSNNRLYIMSPNAHNYLQSYYRYTVLQTVVRDFISQNRDMNISLMRFNGGNGGYVIKESTLAYDADDATVTAENQKDIIDAMDNIYEFDDSTPLTETLWEAYRYATGQRDYYGDDSGTNTPAAAYSSGDNYNSPIDYECQKTRIVMLTDGAPTSDTGRDSQIESSSYFGSNCSGNCMDEFAYWIFNDSSTSPPQPRDHSSALVGTQQVVVDTIGFGPATDAALLSSAASNGGGLYRTAANASELAAAFKSIGDQTAFEQDTFVAPAVAVNAYSGLTHRDELYFALFEPKTTTRWHGNIKKYRLENGKIVDQNSNDAIDDADTNELDTGFFKTTALSIWSTITNFDGLASTGNTDGKEVDGAEIQWGGHAYELEDPSARNIYTYISSSAPNNVSLTNESVEDANTNITTDLLGLGASTEFTEADRTDILNWARGYEEGSDPDDNTPNFFIADMVHSQPVVVTYFTKDTDNLGNKITDPDDIEFDDTLFAASNMGFFHAIDPENGSEGFAFIPQELLANLTAYYNDSGSFSDKVYGLDAAMTVWRNDRNNNGKIVTTAGGLLPETDTDGNEDHVYIYQPMRRGGKSIYALDVTNRTNPKLLWQIDGGTGGTTGFSDLAQTWSTPQLGKVKFGSSEKYVLFFGGGYDPVHDSATTPTTGDEGAAIYMVDAETGDLIWKADSSIAGFAAMDNSIPADVTIADVDGDGYTDFLFAVDIQGTVWRVDFPNISTGQADFLSQVTGGPIANLGGTNRNFRRFFNPPDVAYFSERGRSAFLTISIASGHREDPRETFLDDFLFVTFDPHALNAPTNYNYNGSTIITANDLGTVENNNGTTSGSPSTYGWKLALGESGEGEKGLSRTVTFEDQILMTTYTPATDTCNAGTGSSKFYLLDALVGATLLKDENGNIVDYKDLYDGGIPPDPAIIFTTTDQCVENCNDGDDSNDVTEKKPDLVVCVGTECINDAIDLSLHKTYWREN